MIYGAGGVGSNAIQGARYAGAKNVVVVDPIALKREYAQEFGATHVFGDAQGAHEAVQDMTWGQLAEHAIIQGHVFGMCNPLYDVPRLLRLYRDGQLKLDELITHRYSLDEINRGYDDLEQGRNIRGVIMHED